MSKTNKKTNPKEEKIDIQDIDQAESMENIDIKDTESADQNLSDTSDKSENPDSNTEDTETKQNSSDPKETDSEVKSDSKKDHSIVDTKGIVGDEKPIVKIPDGAKWYILHTYAGHENKVARSLKQRAEAMKFDDRVFDIIVPTRNTIKVSGGKKETVQEKIFPGYVLVRMLLDDESWFMVRSTPGVTSFIGAGNKPTPISEKEVEAIMKFMKQEEPTYKAAFTIGEAVKITDGPFSEFLGTIDSIDDARGKVKVLVSIFGRETPVELDFLQVKKI